MLNVALPLLENAINRCLQTDLQALAQLQMLQGKVIALRIVDWNIHCYVHPKHNGIELQRKHAGTPDTMLSGKLENLVKVGIAKDKTSAMRRHQLQFQGDIHTGMALQQLLSQLDIDWEGLLAERIGDTPAYTVSQGLQKLNTAGKAFVSSIKRNLSDYIHHEARLSPTASELDGFYRDVSELRHAVERLEARIRQLNTASRS